MTGGGVKALRHCNYLKEFFKIIFLNEPWLKIYLKKKYFLMEYYSLR
jgi:hypothetical protein